MVFRSISALVVALFLSLGLVACEKEGPAERAGKQIDQGIENAKDAVRDVFQGQGPAEKAGEKLDRAMEGKD
jgi:predicted small lipoprotein YifL